MKQPINVTRSSMPPFDEYCAEIKDMWDSHWLTNNGVKHEQLTSELTKYLDTPNLTLFVNGHLALEVILAAMNLTGEVITTPFTFASTTHAIVRCGLTPVFCDINPDDYTVDVSKIESLINEQTSAIVPVHVYGNLCDVDNIQKIADKHGLKVIYDAAHAFGVKKDGISSANFGDASMFSFHATKVFNTIEGGAVTYKDENLTVLLNDMKNFGIRGLESVAYVGGNAKMNEFQAAMGLCNLRHIDEEIAKRRAVDERYREHLSGIQGVKLSTYKQGIMPNYAYFPVVFDGYRLNRDEVYEKLMKTGVIARKYFYPLTNSYECYKGRPGFDPDDTPVAKHIADSVLTLPIYADISLSDVDCICNIVAGHNQEKV